MKYVLSRIGSAIIMLLAVSALTFSAMNLLGDPLFNILGPLAADTNNPESVALIEEAEERYYLDDPLPVRYVRWLGDFATGDMGVQFGADGQPPVTDLLKTRAPRTATLIIMAQLLATLISIPWALFAASRANRPADHVSTAITFAVIALPSFAMGVILKYLLGVRYSVFPLTYVADASFVERLYQLFLPALTIALPVAGVYQRLLRTELITNLQEDFILMARSKGVSRRDVLFRHALRPSMFSFITVFAINTGTLIGGAFVVEQIFIIPGLGSAIVEAVLREDFPVVLAIVMVITSVFVIVNLIVDLLYTVIDPRVRR